MSPVITGFHGKYEWLSNDFECNVLVDGTSYPSMTHYYKSQILAHPEKTMTDPETDRTITEREYIMFAPTAEEVCRRSWQMIVRSDLNTARDSLMMKGLRAKFSNPELRRKLSATHNIELLNVDYSFEVYWSIDMSQGIQGKNRLGELLMELREELKNGN